MRGCIFKVEPFYMFFCWQMMVEGRVREINMEQVAYRLLRRLLHAYPPCQLFKVALQMACPPARDLPIDALQSIAHTTAGRLVLAMDLICKVLVLGGGHGGHFPNYWLCRRRRLLHSRRHAG